MQAIKFIEFIPTNPNDQLAAGARLVLNPQNIVAVVAPPKKASELIIDPKVADRPDCCAIWVAAGNGFNTVWVLDSFTEILAKLAAAGVSIDSYPPKTEEN